MSWESFKARAADKLGYGIGLTTNIETTREPNHHPIQIQEFELNTLVKILVGNIGPDDDTPNISDQFPGGFVTLMVEEPDGQVIGLYPDSNGYAPKIGKDICQYPDDPSEPRAAFRLVQSSQYQFFATITPSPLPSDISEALQGFHDKAVPKDVLDRFAGAVAGEEAYSYSCLVTAP